MSVQVGIADLTAANWDARLDRVKARLCTAVTVTNSVVDRVKIWNLMVLPSFIFTALYIKPPDDIVARLVRLSKQFMWHLRLAEDNCRHKIAVSLVHAPVPLRGISRWRYDSSQHAAPSSGLRERKTRTQLIGIISQHADL